VVSKEEIPAMKRKPARKPPGREALDMAAIMVLDRNPGLLGQVLPVAPDPARLREILKASGTLRRAQGMVRAMGASASLASGPRG